MGAAIDVVDGAVFHLGVGAGLGHALAVVLKPDDAAVEVGAVGVGGEKVLEGFQGGVELGFGGVAEVGCGVECGPAGGLRWWAGVDYGCRSWFECGLAVMVADDVEDEDADDDGEEDVVAWAEAHSDK